MYLRLWHTVVSLVAWSFCPIYSEDIGDLSILFSIVLLGSWLSQDIVFFFLFFFSLFSAV